MLEEQRTKGQQPGYDRRCRHLSDEQRAFEAEGRKPVVRFARAALGTAVVHDLIRSDIEVESRSVQDPVILKSDGMPTSHPARMVVDDHLMQITRVLRGEEWISSAPLHKQLYDAFGWPMPHLVHLPVILDPSGKGKMSKRKKVVAGKEYLALVHGVHRSRLFARGNVQFPGQHRLEL